MTLQEQFGQIDIYVFDQILRGNIAQGMRVLDAGFGGGRNLVYLLREGYEVFGAMSIGVLHHIPDTQQALNDCVKKIKKKGYFYVYLYYNLDKRGRLFTSVFKLSDVLRNWICKLPGGLKKIVCDILAIIIYLPLVLWVRFLLLLGFPQLAKRMPLSAYHNKSFFIIQ